MVSISHFRRRYLESTLGRWPDDLDIEAEDVLGVLRARVHIGFAAKGRPEPRTPPYIRTASFNIPAGPPSSRLRNERGERSFHLGINKPKNRPAGSFDKYSRSKGGENVAERFETLEDGGRSPAGYDVYSSSHGRGIGTVSNIPDYDTSLTKVSERRSHQWDKIEEHERSRRKNCDAGPPRIAIFYERAQNMFDRAAALPDCPTGLRVVIKAEQARVAQGRVLSKREHTIGVAWIDENAHSAQQWLESLEGWSTDQHKDRRLSRLSAGRNVKTHIAGEIEYPAALLNHPEARARVRAGFFAYLQKQRNGEDPANDGSVVPCAVFDHLPDRLNDRRNLHCHFLSGVRRVWIDDEGEMTFADRQLDGLTRKGSIEAMRAEFAKLCNIELDQLKVADRLHPGTLEQMSITGASAQRKLFSRAVVLERAGIPTTHGAVNDLEGWRRAFARADQRHRDRVDAVERRDLLDREKQMMLQAAQLRRDAEEVGLLIGMTVSRAKRTARFAPGYAEAAKQKATSEGCAARGAEAHRYLADLDLALERAAVVAFRREALRLENAASTSAEQARSIAQLAKTHKLSAHRAVDTIANTPLLLSESDGQYLVGGQDDPKGLVANVSLDAPDIQRRLRGQYATQQKELAQVRSFINKHGFASLRDEDLTGQSAWLGKTIERWRMAPVLLCEERERTNHAKTYRAMLDERRKRWKQSSQSLEEEIAAGSVSLATNLSVSFTADISETPPTTAAGDVISWAQFSTVPRSAPLPSMPNAGTSKMAEASPWTPSEQPVPITPKTVALWREQGVERFAKDATGFEHILHARPSTKFATDGRLSKALGPDALWLTEPTIVARLDAIWLYQQEVRDDLIATRQVDAFINQEPLPGSPEERHNAVIEDRHRHRGDASLIRMFEAMNENPDHYPAAKNPLWPRGNRLLRAVRKAIVDRVDPATIRILADAVHALPNERELRVALSEEMDRAIWQASSRPSRGVFWRPLGIDKAAATRRHPPSWQR